MDQQVTDLQTVQSVFAAIGSMLSLEDVLATTCRAVVDLFDVDHSGLVIFDDDRGEGTVAAEYPDLGAVGKRIPVRGVPIEEELLASKRPLLLHDLSHTPTLDPVQQTFAELNIGSILIIPVLLNGEVYGSFSLDVIGRTRRFTQAEIDLCQVFAAQVSVAVTNARLLQITSRQKSQLDTLHQFSRKTARYGDSDLAQRIVAGAITLLNARSGGLYKYDDRHRQLTLIAAHGPAPELVGTRLSLGEGMAGKLLVENASFSLVENYARWPNRASVYDGKQFFGSVIEVPLRRDEQILGVLYVDDAVGRTFTHQDVYLLQLFADQASVALQHAALIVEDAQKLSRLEKLTRASSEIMARVGRASLDEVLALICRRVADILDAEACSICLVERPGVLTFRACHGYSPNVSLMGRDFVVRSGPRSGLTGHIAYEGTLFNAHGAELTTHSAVRGEETPSTASQECFSMLALPLKNQDNGALIGLLRADNKRGPEGAIGPELYFDQQDEWIIRLFANTAVVALESAGLLKKVNEKSEHVDRLLRSAPNGVIANRRDGSIFFYNDQAEALLGYLPDEVLQRPVRSIFADPLEPYRIARLLLAAADGRLLNHETTLVNRDGEKIPIRMSATWLYDGDGRNIGTVGYFEDLRTVRETQRRLSLMLVASDVLARADGLADGLQGLAEKMITLLGASFCYILTVDESRAFLEAQAFAPQPETAVDAWHRLLDQHVELSLWPALDSFLQTGNVAALLVGDERLPQVLEQDARVLGIGNGREPILTIPLRTGEQVVGLMYVGGLRGRGIASFTDDVLEMMTAIAGQTAVLIDRMMAHEASRRRERLLASLEENSRHIRAEKEIERLWQEIARQAAQLSGCTVGGIFRNSPHQKILTLVTVYGLPADLTGSTLTHHQGLIGAVAANGQVAFTNRFSDWADPDPIFIGLGFETVVGVPLKEAGVVEAVLFVADRSSRHRVWRTELEILGRLADQATIALRTSRLIGSEQRTLAQIAILHRISHYVQSTNDLQKILHVVLTGITAGYGLAFNRAVILLLDESRSHYVGSMGIGHLQEPLAMADWMRDHEQGLYDFGQYIEKLEENELTPTPLGQHVQQLRFSLRDEGAFAQVAANGRPMHVPPQKYDLLPPLFLQAFVPETAVIIVPLLVQDQTIGVIVADNKFTQAPITPESVELLLAFAATAAVAIDKTKLFLETKRARERLNAFYEASNLLVSSQDLDSVLQDIVSRAQEASQSSWVSLMLIDKNNRLQKVKTAVADPDFTPTGNARPNGISMQVMRDGRPVIIEDVQQALDRVNPSMLRDQVAAAVCLPLELRETRLGVMWIHYDQPHHFPPAELEALKLFVNQAAIAYANARRMHDLHQMRQAAESLAGASDLPDVLDQITTGAREVMAGESAVFWSYDDQRNKFILKDSVSSNMPAEIWRAFCAEEPRPGGTVYGIMVRGWDGITAVGNVQEEARLSQKTRRLLLAADIHSFQGIPLQVGKEKLGVLYVNYARPHSFGEDEQQAARTFATHAALALKKARLLDRLRKARNTARIVASVTTLEALDVTLRSVVTGTKEALNCDAVTLFMYDDWRKAFVGPPYMLGVWDEEKAQQAPFAPADSLAYQILAHGGIYLAENAPDDALFSGSRFTREEKIASTVAIPLRVSDTPVGVMFVNFRTSHRFTGDELENIEMYANQAAVAIHNGQLYRRKQQRTLALQALYDAGRAMSVSLDSQEILRHIVSQAWHLVSSQDEMINYASIWQVTDERHARVVATYPPQALQQTRETLGELVNWQQGKNGRIGIMGRAIKTGETVLVRDVTQDADYLQTQQETRSELAVPIKRGQQVMGVINLEHVDFDAFDVDVIRVLEVLADQASVAIQNATLYEKALRHAELLAAAAQVASQAITILDEEKLLNETVQLISERLNFYHVAVFLLDESGQYASIRAASSAAGAKMVARQHKLKVGEDGIVGLVALTGHYHLTPDVQKDTQHLRNPNLPETRAEMTFPLIARGRVIGVLDVQSQRAMRLPDEDVAALQTMANQLANAILNARYYDEVQNRVAMLETLYNASKVVSGSLELDKVLAAIVEQAWRLTGASGPKARFCCLTVVRDDSLKFMAAYPPETLPALQATVGTISLSQPRRYGIMGRAVKLGEPQLVGDVTRDDNYLVYDPDTRSELAVPIKVDGQVIGVINVEHEQPYAFDLEDKRMLEALATHAGIAMDKSQRFQELRQTFDQLHRANKLVRARTAVAWMGLASSIWRHDIENHALTIKERVRLLRDDADPVYLARIKTHLQTIQRLATKIHEKPITMPLSIEDGIESVGVNELFRERAGQLWQNEPYQTAELNLALHLPEQAAVRLNAQWVRRAFDFLVDNAVEAMQPMPERRLRVSTKQRGDFALITIADTGPGLPPGLEEKIGLEHIEKPEDASGLGMGLLMAQMIVQAYGGEIRVGHTGEDGTAMEIYLPLETKES